MLEDILRQVRTVLQNQLPAKLDQIELERADGVTLDDIRSFFLQGEYKGSRYTYPNVAIMGGSTTGTNASLPPSPRRELRHRISIWVTDRVVAPDSELPLSRLWRYVEAIERILTSDLSLGGKATWLEVTKHGYYPHHKEREEFVRKAILDVEVLERISTSNY
ncbi:MAG TPA: hypothetical protein VJZ02_02735 [Candidatus Brocadiales bacterium]|nr:hypothetical protein [Candidatus Brocadiales bacterium]